MGTAHTAQAFARLAGVTPKTLRHYERRRLIVPRRNAAGYRVYSDRDRRRVSEIVSLKALGLSLTQIRDVIDGRVSPLDLVRAQREALEAKRRSIERAITVIGEVEKTAATSPDRALPALIAEASWSHAEQRRGEAAPVARPPDRAGASRIALAHETLRAIDAGGDVEGLRSRWRTMLAEEAAANPGLAEELEEVRASRRYWPRGMREWAASLYEMDVESFERLGRFIDSTWGSAPQPHLRAKPFGGPP